MDLAPLRLRSPFLRDPCPSQRRGHSLGRRPRVDPLPVSPPPTFRRAPRRPALGCPRSFSSVDPWVGPGRKTPDRSSVHVTDGVPSADGRVDVESTPDPRHGSPGMVGVCPPITTGSVHRTRDPHPLPRTSPDTSTQSPRRPRPVLVRLPWVDPNPSTFL